MPNILAPMQIGDAPTSPHWQLALGREGVVQQFADIEQCVRVILGTPQGSDPLRPLFGSRVHNWLDWPLETARPHIVREVMTALAEWEPRIAVVSVDVRRQATDGNSGERGYLLISWRVADDLTGVLSTTKILLGAT